MGLIGGIARTAVIAGTATAVSNNVSRRQARRWAVREAPAPAADPPGPYPAAGPPPYPAGGPPPYEPAPVPEDDLAVRLDRLTQLWRRGQLTDEEFSAAKAKLLDL
jgi:hypothetical protein